MTFARPLQDENEEMGKELAEGKLHSLERQTALSRSYAEDIRARYVELEDHLHALDMENESLHQQVSHWTANTPREGHACQSALKKVCLLLPRIKGLDKAAGPPRESKEIKCQEC